MQKGLQNDRRGGRGICPQHLPLLFVLNTLLNLEQKHSFQERQQMLSGGSVSGDQGMLTVWPPVCPASFPADLCLCLGSHLGPGHQTPL